MRRTVLAATATLLLVVVSSTVWAQGTWPSRPIRFIVPFPPGGATDAVARLVGHEMVKTFGQQVLVENRGGGGGTIGVPAATPRDIVTRLNQEVVRIVSLAEIREKFIASGVEARSSSIEETAAFARDQVEKWGQRFRASGVKLE